MEEFVLVPVDVFADVQARLSGSLEMLSSCEEQTNTSEKLAIKKIKRKWWSN